MSWSVIQLYLYCWLTWKFQGTFSPTGASDDWKKPNRTFWVLSRGFLRLKNTVSVPSRASLTSWGEVSSLALVDHTSGDGVTVKLPSGIDVLLHPPALHPILFCWLVKTDNWDWRREITLVVAVINVDGYPFSAFPDLTCHLENTGMGVFWLHYHAW